ncbi:protein HEG isoform X3 [Alligator mississippiensis]|uniref:protein HEG isoform X3 n=1 Tax=Alligator mississippiensis TaxID=8496 RepID=UPI002877CDED|nr:protein HEG isoform X3 [Alligator mississippiensis]
MGWDGLLLSWVMLQVLGAGTPPSPQSHASVDPSTLRPTSPGGNRTGDITEGLTDSGEPDCSSGQPCPPWSTCEAWAGRVACRCSLGFHFIRALGCVPARTFPGRLSLRDTGLLPRRHVPATELHRVATQLEGLFQPILGGLDGYLASSVLDLQPRSAAVTVLHSFSALAGTSERQVDEAVVWFQVQCLVSDPACHFLRHIVSYHSLSLCELEPCDPVSTHCNVQDGLARCPCRPGYHPARPPARACTACASGFQLQDGVCTRCPFGFSGFQCEEPFLLALVAVSCAGGLLLLLLLATLVLLGRARAPVQPPSPAPPPFPARGLSLPRVRPRWLPEELEMREHGPGPQPRWDGTSLRPGPLPVPAPPMKTFVDPRSSRDVALQRGGSQANLVFVSHEDWARRDYF